MNYSRMCQFLATTVAANGEMVAWQQSVPTIPNASQPWKSAGTAPTSTNVQVMFVRAGGGALSAFLHFASKDTDVPQHGIRLIVPHVVGWTPQLTDALTRSDGDVFMIDSIDKIGPASSIVGYVVTANRGN